MTIFLLTMAVFLFLLFLGVDVVFSFILTGMFYILFITDIPIQETVLASRGITLVGQSYTILAVPLFILAASLLNESGVTQRLVAFGVALVGNVRGGLGHAVVVSNMFMAGMSGSATADAAGIGKIMIPALVRAGYSPASAAALSASAATLGPILPPSIAMVLYASLANISLGALLLAAVVPGLLMGVFLMIGLYFSAEAKTVTRTPFQWRVLARTGLDAVIALAMPLVILGGMFLGTYTPTEGAAIAVVYALFMGLVIYRTLRLKQLWIAFSETAIMTGAILLVVMGANGLSWLLTADRVGDALAPAFFPFESMQPITLLILAGITLVLGTAMEEVTMLILMTPILAPTVLLLEIDPVLFGVVFVLATMIGLITPPVGISMFITCRIAGVTTGQFARAVVRPFTAIVCVLITMCVFPQTVLWLPNAVLGT